MRVLILGGDGNLGSMSFAAAGHSVVAADNYPSPDRPYHSAREQSMSRDEVSA
ncbi:MAG TPA: hypothetical protein VMM55_13880 [Thermohalobaculum sp.]|nr:hypothetical protein [Thermohalobaculum sp.]